ncbi:dienelactone hydrolase [Aspergillus aculeatinus CBS 121060]|uniref:Dienelactone hydrolase n=1 Tax=Aspergillus aculeatinus CBS 121060 TaxID=1448322 RepID=A0ACD1GUG9_9EURO|nr:dienelactone hydrolase [Aspergillus aculeatinus CBS 121060]RAH65003.1 dienelactone hydrolase [Aspergillus aculeatinus CBS 121060]
MDPILAKPVGACCFKGSIHTGEPKGKVEQIAGVDTYIATPDANRSNGHVLLFFPDAFGLHINNFLTMDSFAAAGYLTLGVDYFAGDPVWRTTANPLTDPTFDFDGWKNKHMKSSDDIAARWVKEVDAIYNKDGNVKFVCAGHCWGARFVCTQLSKAGICKAGAIAHPSFINESHVSQIDAPILLSVANIDGLFPAEQRSRAIEILTNEEKKFNIQIFSGVGHGFASRAFLEDPYERWAKEQSFRSFLDWFEMWLS